MPDEDRPEVVYEHGGNSTRRGRYGTAPEDAPHMTPEVPPLGMEDVPLNPPEGTPGALPENKGRPPDEEARDEEA